PPRNPVIRECSMPAILRRTACHVAAYAVGLGGVRFCQLSLMTRLATGVVSLGRRRDRRMGVVTGSAPQLSLAVASACAQRQLLRVADHFEGLRARAGVNSEHVFQSLTRMKVHEILAGVQDACRANKMALFADTVARRRSQLCRVD